VTYEVRHWPEQEQYLVDAMESRQRMHSSYSPHDRDIVAHAIPRREVLSRVAREDGCEEGNLLCHRRGCVFKCFSDTVLEL
jgi:hypothetical protein